MVDLKTQLGDYFDHVVQHVAVEDVREERLGSGPVRLLQPRVTLRPRRWAVAVAGFGVALLAIGGVALLLRSDDRPPAGEPGPAITAGSTVPTTGEAPVDPSVVEEPTLPDPPPVIVGGATPITVPVVEGGEVMLEPAPVQFGPRVGFARAGGTLWAWDGFGRVAHYRDGAWGMLPELRATVLDVTSTSDGRVLAITTNRSPLWVLDEGEWRQLPADVLWVLDEGVWRRFPEELLQSEQIEVDERTGLVWTSSEDSLYRWSGTEVTRIDGPGGWDRRIAVTADGTVWSAVGLDWDWWGGDRPEGSGLFRYHPDTDTWETVRPAGGGKDDPAWLAPTPNGDLWVLLLTDRPAQEPFPEIWVLAYFDVAADEWSAYRLPDGYPVSGSAAMAADDESVWVSFGGELLRFDRQTLTTYQPDQEIREIGVGADGTIWVYHGYPTDSGLWLVDLP